MLGSQGLPPRKRMFPLSSWEGFRWRLRTNMGMGRGRGTVRRFQRKEGITIEMLRLQFWSKALAKASSHLVPCCIMNTQLITCPGQVLLRSLWWKVGPKESHSHSKCGTCIVFLVCPRWVIWGQRGQVTLPRQRAAGLGLQHRAALAQGSGHWTGCSVS